MDARLLRLPLLAALLCVSMGASYRTANFIVQTRDPKLAGRIALAAEKFRKELAVEWIGQEMPNWAAPCPMTVHVGSHLGAGGATTFVFNQGEVYDWRMTIQGSAERILDSVLPHEITHMIFACHFRQPVPRWADEGAASSVEHAAERSKHHRMLVGFLRTGRGIAFNQMFAMREYPPDVGPLYAQGLTLAEFLIQQGGRRKFVDYLGEGMETGRWSEVTRRHYGITDLSALQNQWLAWVGQGMPKLTPPAVMLADAAKRPRPEPNLIHRVSNEQPRGPVTQGAGRWHAPGATPIAVETPKAAPLRTQLARPQPIERSRQIILQWAKGRPTSTGAPATMLR